MLGACIVALAGSLLAQEARVVEEQPSHWVKTYSGEFVSPPGATLRLITRGHVIVRGAGGDRVGYMLTERVRARTLENAQRLFGKVIATMMRRDAAMTLTLLPMSAEPVAVEWNLNVPRRIGSLLISTQIGDVEAYDLDGSVHVDTAAGQVHCDRIGGGVEANTGGGEIRLGRVGGPARCISAAGSILIDSAARETVCRTAGGEIQVRDAGGPLTLSTEGGNIEVDRAGSSVEAHTGEGTIQIVRAAGAVLADTRGGAIDVGGASGANCQSAAGMVRVKASAGPLKIETAMGSILAELLSGSRLNNSSLLAGSGDITVLIPSNLALSVVARNDSGASPRIFSDFSELRARPASLRQAAVFEGAINGGGPVLMLDTSGGVIYLKKK
ncbi:MAG TPA: hypothetical protein VKX39_03995 [Bryobacteraceae bacterium]|jgi:DUF4097 and DUF4098 domain-containing protein YvlB|nr:hypothetical protein [Bryobacteraceae bacterium]